MAKKTGNSFCFKKYIKWMRDQHYSYPIKILLIPDITHLYTNYIPILQIVWCPLQVLRFLFLLLFGNMLSLMWNNYEQYQINNVSLNHCMLVCGYFFVKHAILINKIPTIAEFWICKRKKNLYTLWSYIPSFGKAYIIEEYIYWYYSIL